jgi:hypothetical protein
MSQRVLLRSYYKERLLWWRDPKVFKLQDQAPTRTRLGITHSIPSASHKENDYSYMVSSIHSHSRLRIPLPVVLLVWTSAMHNLRTYQEAVPWFASTVRAVMRHGSLATIGSYTRLSDEGTKRCSSTRGYHFQRQFSGKMCGVCFGSFTVSSNGCLL